MTSSQPPEPRRPLLLGEMPSEAGDRYHMVPLSGSPAARLSVWAGLKREGTEAWYWTLTRAFDTMNAQERYAPKFDLPAARERWTAYLMEEENYRKPVVVICLGRWAQKAIGATEAGEWFYWYQAGLLTFVTIPHPSARNRLWNEKANKMAAQRVLREALFIASQPRGTPVIEDGRVVAMESTAVRF